MILQQIVADASEAARERERHLSLAAIERAAAAAPLALGFARALQQAPGGIGLIAELKKASPSAGVLRSDFAVEPLSTAFAAAGAAALSVLTESRHFQGDLANLGLAACSGLPRLQKDFLTNEWQILEGRAAGADAVLLIAEALDDRRAEELCRLALELGMDVLCEAHTPALVRREARRAERDPQRILVGINNRNLQTFEVTLEHSFECLRQLPRDLLLVSESGIRDAHDVRRLRDAGARGILVGTTLMRAADPGAAAAALLHEVLHP